MASAGRPRVSVRIHQLGWTGLRGRYKFGGILFQILKKDKKG